MASNLTGPSYTDGVPAWENKLGTVWRLVVEVCDDKDLSAGSWVDITDDVQGIDITRGRPDGNLFGGHPDVGVMLLRLADPAAGAKWAPYHLTTLGRHLQADHAIRVSMVSPTDWRPLFTGEIETAIEETPNYGGDRYTDITANETAQRLRGVQLIDYVHYTTPRSAGPHLSQLCSDVGWPYGVISDVQDVPGFTGKTLLFGNLEYSGNALDTARRVADAATMRIMNLLDGRIAIGRRWPDPMGHTAGFPSWLPTLNAYAHSELLDDVRLRAAPHQSLDQYRWEGVWQQGIFGGATVSPGPSPSPRRLATASASHTEGMWSTNVHLEDPNTVDKTGATPGRWNTYTATSAGSFDTKRTRVVADLPGSSLGYQVAQLTCDGMISLFANPADLWVVDRVIFHESLFEVWGDIEPGSRWTYLHDLDDPPTYRFDGHIAGYRLQITPERGQVSMTWTGTADMHDRSTL